MSVMLLWEVSSAVAATSTLTFTAKCNGSGTANDNVAWTITSDGTESKFDATKGIHYGTTSASVQYINLTTSGISGTITKIVVNASTASGVSATVGVTVGGSAFGGNAQSLTSTATNYSFEGSASGEIVVSVTKSSSATKALYVKSIAVTYSSGSTKTDTQVTFPQESYSASYPGTFSGPTATVKAGDTTVTSPSVSYSSNNTSVASVDSSTGAVTLNSVGTAVITATYSGNNTYNESTGSYTLNVTDGRTITTTTFESSTYEAIVGQSFQSPIATVKAGNTTISTNSSTLSYSSSNTSVASINASTGAVTINAAGSTVITATYSGNTTYQGSTGTYTLVVSTEGGSSTTGYNLYSGTLTEGDYVIYYSDKAMKATVSSNRLGYSEVTPTNDVIETTDATIIWHIAPSGNYWTIYNAGQSKYAASNGTKNQAQLLADGTDNKSLWTVTESNGTYEFVNLNNSSNSVNANLRNNGTYGFACYSTNTGGALSLYRYTSSETPTTVSQPTITPSSTSFWPATTETPTLKVTIAAPENTYVRYTTDGSTPSASSGQLVTSSTVVSVTGTTTIKAISYYSGDTSLTSDVKAETYTLGQTVNSISAFKALESGTEARLYLSPDNNARILHASGNNLYLRDNTGAICLYLNQNTNAYKWKRDLAHDQHVAGWIIGKNTTYNGLPELAATQNTTTNYLAIADMVTEDLTEPVEITASQFDDYKADWVTVPSLRLGTSDTDITATAITDDATQLVIYNSFGLDATGHYTSDMAYSGALADMTGIAIPYNSKKEIAPIFYNNYRPLVYVIDEQQDFTSPSSDISGATIRLVRTFSNSYWNTISLPFDMDIEGSLREYNELSDDGKTMIFKDATGVVAGIPYLYKPAETTENPIFYDVTLTSTLAQTVEDGGFSYVATYSPVTLKTDQTEQFLKTNGELAYPANESKARMRGLRAYFVMPSDSQAKVKIEDDDNATYIEVVPVVESLTNSDVFTVTGQYVGRDVDLGTLPKGIYIVNGKKMLIK